jgi:hypothetical protein
VLVVVGAMVTLCVVLVSATVVDNALEEMAFTVVVLSAVLAS